MEEDATLDEFDYLDERDSLWAQMYLQLRLFCVARPNSFCPALDEVYYFIDWSSDKKDFVVYTDEYVNRSDAVRVKMDRNCFRSRDEAHVVLDEWNRLNREEIGKFKEKMSETYEDWVKRKKGT